MVSGTPGMAAARRSAELPQYVPISRIPRFLEAGGLGDISLTLGLGASLEEMSLGLGFPLKISQGRGGPLKKMSLGLGSSSRYP